jgi:acetyltransferase-like isoleucine patch superfamily enzyme
MTAVILNQCEWGKAMRKSRSKIHNVKAAENVHVVEPVNLYDCNLGQDVFVGPFCEIQADVTIGDRTKIQSHAFICSLVQIGSDCFVGHGVMFINDTFNKGKPAKGDKSQWSYTHIADRVFIGSNATILPVKICSDVVIGAGAVVTKDIIKSGTYVGNPAKRLK